MAEASSIRTSADAKVTGLIPMREHFISAGVRVTPIAYPDYMPNGEVRVEDPDGYTLLIGQAG